jgi:transcriptional regulator with XRE-family HTH domain
MMVAMNEPATFSDVAEESGAERCSGQAFKARREALGMGRTPLARRAGVDPSRIRMLEEDDPRLRGTTVAAIDRALGELEHEMGMDSPSQVVEVEKPHLIRIEVQGVYGAKALIVEGDPEDRATLEAMVDRIMRNLRDDDKNSE